MNYKILLLALLAPITLFGANAAVTTPSKYAKPENHEAVARAREQIEKDTVLVINKREAELVACLNLTETQKSDWAIAEKDILVAIEELSDVWHTAISSKTPLAALRHAWLKKYPHPQKNTKAYVAMNAVALRKYIQESFIEMSDLLQNLDTVKRPAIYTFEDVVCGRNLTEPTIHKLDASHPSYAAAQEVLTYFGVPNATILIGSLDALTTPSRILWGNSVGISPAIINDIPKLRGHLAKYSNFVLSGDYERTNRLDYCLPPLTNPKSLIKKYNFLKAALLTRSILCSAASPFHCDCVATAAAIENKEEREATQRLILKAKERMDRAIRADRRMIEATLATVRAAILNPTAADITSYDVLEYCRNTLPAKLPETVRKRCVATLDGIEHDLAKRVMEGQPK